MMIDTLGIQLELKHLLLFTFTPLLFVICSFGFEENGKRERKKRRRERGKREKEVKERKRKREGEEIEEKRREGEKEPLFLK